MKIGSRLTFPIRDDHNVLLLAEGLLITPAFINHLNQRGVLSVEVHESEMARICAGEPQGTAESVPEHREGAFCPLKNAGTEELDEKIRQGQLDLPPQGEAFANELHCHGATAYDQKAKSAGYGLVKPFNKLS